MNLIVLSLASFLAWFIYTLAGGGSPMILVPLVNVLLSPQAVAPVVTTGLLVGLSQQSWMFWEFIDWQVTWWYLPGAIAGAVLGAYAFTQINLEWLQFFIGVFLIFTVGNYWFGKKERTFTMCCWQFLPVGFLHAFTSGIIGSSGPAMNVFFLNYNFNKEQMIATKATNTVIIHVVKMFTYASLGALKLEYLLYGLVIGLAAIPANFLGQYVLKKMDEKQFRQLVFAFMGVTGVLMVWQQRQIVDLGIWEWVMSNWQLLHPLKVGSMPI